MSQFQRSFPAKAMATAIIPARGGSKGVPNKNLKKVGSYSLLARAILACKASALIERIIVSTDSAVISEEAKRFEAEVVVRPSHLATDLSRSEEALLHAIAEGDVTSTVLAFVECTSPFINPEDLDEAIVAVGIGDHETVFAAVESSDLMWVNSEGLTRPLGHDPYRQTMRQERNPLLKESGAFYALNLEGFLGSQNRFFGRIGYVLTEPDFGLEIDSEEDLRIAQILASWRDQTLSHLKESRL